MNCSSWKEYTIGESCSLLTGFAFKSKEYLEKGKYKVVRGDNVKTGFIYWEEKSRFWNEINEKLEKYILNVEDIVIGMDGSRVGRNRAIIQEKDLPALLAQRVACIRANNKLFDQAYIKYIIMSSNFEKYVEAIKTGTSIPHISLKQIAEFKFNAPKLEEQIKISSILSSLDKKIELNNEMNKTLEEMAQTLFKRWFIDFEFPNENGEPYKSSDGEIVESELGMIPKGWRIDKIANIVDVTDYVANGSFASLKQNVTYSEKEDFAILIRLVDYNRNFNGPFTYVDKKGYEFLSKSKLFGGEVVISNVGANAGTVFKVPNLEKPMTLGPNSIMLIPNIYKNYLYLLFTSSIGQESLKSILSGSAQPKFNKTEFRNLRCIVPSIDIVEKFNNIIVSTMEIMEDSRGENDSLIELRDSLLPKLMSGEVRVEDVEANL